MNELDFLQQLLQLQQNGTGFLGSTTQYRSPVTASTIMPAVQAAMTGITGVGAASGAAVPAASGMAGAAGAASGLAALTPGIGLGLSAVSTLMAYNEAGKLADKQRAADRENERLVLEAERLKQQNEYAAARVPVEAFDRQFREGTAANAQAIDALSQDPRMLLGGIQGVQEATIEGQAKAREALADRVYNDSMTKAGAQMAVNQDLSKLYLDQAEGASIAAMAAEKAKIAQQQAALQGVGGLVTQGMGQIGTYGGLANQGDQLQTLLGGTSFARPAAQGMDPKMMQAFSQFLKTYQTT